MCKDSRKGFISQFQAVKWQASKKAKKLTKKLQILLKKLQKMKFLGEML